MYNIFRAISENPQAIDMSTGNPRGVNLASLPSCAASEWNAIFTTGSWTKRTEGCMSSSLVLSTAHVWGTPRASGWVSLSISISFNIYQPRPRHVGNFKSCQPAFALSRNRRSFAKISETVWAKSFVVNCSRTKRKFVAFSCNKIRSERSPEESCRS